MLSFIRLLFFEGCGFIQNYLTLLCAAVHAYCTLRASANILDILDDFLKFPATNSVLKDDVVHSVSVVVLLGLLWISRMGLRSIVQ